jgi:glycosyltransferase involved in cell wall biosynthesis
MCVLHVTSAAERTASHDLIPNADTEVISNGVEVPATVPQRNWKPGGRLRILFLGRLDPKKGIENLLDAIAFTRTARIVLEICGTGNQNYVDALKSRVSSLGLHDVVRFTGHVDGDQKSNAFFRSDVCVVPSHSENFGMVVAESLAHGVPVIASTGTPWEKLATVRCGYWVSNQPEVLADAIARIAEEDLSAMGERGRSWMKRDFAWTGVASKMHELYLRLCKCGRTRP